MRSSATEIRHGAQGGTRTRTPVSGLGILSPEKWLFTRFHESSRSPPAVLIST